MIPHYAVFRCGERLTIEAYEQMGGEKQELLAGVMLDAPHPLCWPPPATFTRGALLTEAQYQALTFPPGWQTELYQGVVLAWRMQEAEAGEIDVDQARRWVEKYA